MRERLLLFSILFALGVFLFIFQNYFNTYAGLVFLGIVMLVYTLYSIAATKYQKRKLKKHPPIINENYKPFVTIMIPAHNEEDVIANTVQNVLNIDYPHYEVILIDDRSSDNTASVIKLLADQYDNVSYLIRDKDAFPGKSAVLNDTMKMAKGEAILVFDADATVEPDFLTKLVPNLEPADVGAVQARKVIRNKDYNWLTKCQNNEYTFDTYLQAGRDNVKGAAELRGNGELLKRAAIEDVDGWNNYTITDDLDMSTRLHIKGWDVRFCPNVCVYEEGIIYLKALFRQRRRWMEGTVRRYLEYSGEVFKSKKMSLRAKLDMMLYLEEFILPIWFVMEIVFRMIKLYTDMVCPANVTVHNTVISSIVIASIVWIGFYLAIRYALRRYDNVPRWQAIKQAFGTTLYFFALWFPLMLYIFLKVLLREKDMNWGKTTHGLVLEAEAEQEKQHEQEEE